MSRWMSSMDVIIDRLSEHRGPFPRSRAGGSFQYRCINPEWLPRATAFDQRASLRASSEPCSHHGYRCLYAQGRGCTLQQRPPSARSLTPRLVPRRSGGLGGGREAGGGGRPLSSAHGKLEETRVEEVFASIPRRPVTAPEGRGRSREPNQRALIRNPVACPRRPCKAACDTVSWQQVDARKGVSTPTLHLYLPSSRCEEEEEEEEAGSDNARPIQEKLLLRQGADGIDAESLSERPGIHNLPHNELPKDPAETLLRLQEPAFLSAPQDHSDDIRPQDCGEEVRSADPSVYHRLQEITGNQACLPAPKPSPHGGDTEQGRICSPLLITPAAVHNGRPPTSVRHHGPHRQGRDRLPQIQTTKTLVWGFPGLREVKSVCVLQDGAGRYRTNQT